MHLMLRTFLKLLPLGERSMIKKIWRKRLLRQKSAALKKRKEAARIEFGVISLEYFLEEIKELGIEEGDILFVQTSFNDLYTLLSTPSELIEGLRRLIGPLGTLLMPAYTIPEERPDWVFNLNTTPTYTGIVNEVFRRSAGVVRSLHPRHSICGMGYLAEEILADHEKCTYADGAGSPFDKMRVYSNAKILTLGLPPGYVSFLHWIEDIEPHIFAFQSHNSDVRFYKVKGNKTEQIEVKDRLNTKIVTINNFAFLSDAAWKYKNLKGNEIYLYSLPKLASELFELRAQGRLFYSGR